MNVVKQFCFGECNQVTLTNQNQDPLSVIACMREPETKENPTLRLGLSLTTACFCLAFRIVLYDVRVAILTVFQHGYDEIMMVKRLGSRLRNWSQKELRLYSCVILHTWLEFSLVIWPQRCDMRASLVLVSTWKSFLCLFLNVKYSDQSGSTRRQTVIAHANYSRNIP